MNITEETLERMITFARERHGEITPLCETFAESVTDQQLTKSRIAMLWFNCTIKSTHVVLYDYTTGEVR